MSFWIEYHKDQDVYAPYKNSEVTWIASELASLVAGGDFSFMFNMQKDLSDWINISKIEIDGKTVKEISKSISEE